jgi:hypothetical protein
MSQTTGLGSRAHARAMDWKWSEQDPNITLLILP